MGLIFFEATTKGGPYFCLSPVRGIFTEGKPCLRTAFFPPNPLKGDGSPERTFDDAKKYLIKDVRDALKRAKERS